jgi:prepilin-type N-terminal cleavage/methylation domain-containing protein
VKRSREGFTLVEVMLAVAILALGTLVIQEGYLRSADLFGRYKNTLRAQIWAGEKMWEALDGAVHADPPVTGTSEGEFVSGGKRFRWRLEVEPLGTLLYALRLRTEWQEGGRTVALLRETYASKPKEEQPA